MGICRRRFLMTPGNFSYEGLLARASSSFLFETPFRSSGLPVVAIFGYQFGVFRYVPRRRFRRRTTPTAYGRDDVSTKCFPSFCQVFPRFYLGSVSQVFSQVLPRCFLGVPKCFPGVSQVVSQVFPRCFPGLPQVFPKCC